MRTRRARAWAVALLAAGLAIPGPAHAQTIVPDYTIASGEACQIGFAVGEGIRLRLAPSFGPSGVREIVVTLAPGASEGPESLFLGINGHPPAETALTWTLDDEGPWAILDLKDRPELGSALRMGTPGILRVGGAVVDLSGTAHPLALAQDCARERLRSAGVEIDDYPDGVSRLSIGDGPGALTMARLQSLYTPADYPQSALRAEESGTVQAWLFVGPDGKVRTCHLIRTATPALDARTCEIYRNRMRLEPKIDAQGKRVDFWVETVPLTWEMPR